jgi:hypothetical protein
MLYQITVRYGGRRQRCHTYVVEGGDARDAPSAAADELPPDVAPDADLVEVRIAADPEGRS